VRTLLGRGGEDNVTPYGPGGEVDNAEVPIAGSEVGCVADAPSLIFGGCAGERDGAGADGCEVETISRPLRRGDLECVVRGGEGGVKGEMELGGSAFVGGHDSCVELRTGDD